MQQVFMGRYSLLIMLAVGSHPSADETKPLPPAEQYQSLVKAQEQGEAEFQKAYQAAKTGQEREKVFQELGSKSLPDRYAPRFLALIRDHPKDQVAFQAFRWLLIRVRNRPETQEAVEVLIRQRLEDEQLAGVCQTLWYYNCDAGDKLLRAAIAKSPHPSVQGYARFSLAMSLRRSADRLAQGSQAGREPLKQEAEKLLQQVVEKYSSLKHLSGTLGISAERELFELRHLSVGKTAPEINGEDLDGKMMKLSDSRGKVVLLVFWGTWCGPCMADVPHERSLVKRLAGKPFAIVGVNSDGDRTAVRKVCTEKEIPWRSFWDGGSTKGLVASKWNVDGWPTLYLLDDKGVIRYKGDYLQSQSARTTKEGKIEQFSYLDVAVDTLIKEVASEKKP